MPRYDLCIFLILNNDVNSWAYFLFLATIRTPVVSLSILWTVYGWESLKYLLLPNISIMFLRDLVPDWTEIPDGLFIIIKFSLSSITSSFVDEISLFVALYLSLKVLFLLVWGLKFIILIWSFFLSLYELFCFLLLTLILPFLIFFSINACGTLHILFLIHLSKRVSQNPLQ